MKRRNFVVWNLMRTAFVKIVMTFLVLLVQGCSWISEKDSYVLTSESTVFDVSELNNRFEIVIEDEVRIKISTPEFTQRMAWVGPLLLPIFPTFEEFAHESTDAKLELSIRYGRPSMWKPIDYFKVSSKDISKDYHEMSLVCGQGIYYPERVEIEKLALDGTGRISSHNEKLAQGAFLLSGDSVVDVRFIVDFGKISRLGNSCELIPGSIQIGSRAYQLPNIKFDRETWMEGKSWFIQ